jgi:hypothetical protein
MREKQAVWVLCLQSKLICVEQPPFCHISYLLQMQRKNPVHRNRKLNSTRNDKKLIAFKVFCLMGLATKKKQLHPCFGIILKKQATAEFSKES